MENINLEKKSDLSIGDMVYVDAYGQPTLGYSNSSITVKRDKPFKPKMYDFTSNVKYEIVYVEGEQVTLFDNMNFAITISKDKVKENEPFNEKDDFILMVD